jgi:excisionase family DNA binding protein
MTERDPLFDVHEAADYLGGVSTRTVYREIKRRKLRYIKVGGQTRLRQSELDRYLRDAERVA